MNDVRLALVIMSALMCVLASLSIVFDAEDPYVYSILAVAYAICANAWKDGDG